MYRIRLLSIFLATTALTAPSALADTNVRDASVRAPTLPESAGPTDAGGPPDALPPFLQDRVAGGDHWRFETKYGPVHVWRPPGYDQATAGIVVYVHGFYTDVDDAWVDHRLAEQFLASQQNALFIVPEAPSSVHDRPTWRSLGALITSVRKNTNVKRPWGHLVVAGHSGAYRTITRWLDYRQIDHVILLDALYGREEQFAFWLRRTKGHDANKLLVVAANTLRWAEPWIRKQPGVKTIDIIPDKYDDLSPAALKAKILYLRSQYSHMELVTSGEVLPLLLRATRLARVAPPSPARAVSLGFAPALRRYREHRVRVGSAAP